MKILFASSEALPYAASGGLDMVGFASAALSQKKDMDCRVVLPLYRSITPEVRNRMTFLKDINVEVGWRKQYCGIYTIARQRHPTVPLDNPCYFMDGARYGFDDCNALHLLLPCHAGDSAGTGWKPDIIHCKRLADRNDSRFLSLYQYHQEYETSAFSIPFTTSSIRAYTAKRSSQS